MLGELVDHLVVDSGPLIRGVKIEKIGEKIVTVPNVVNEIRDKVTRQRLSVLPYELDQRNPTEASMKFVHDFAKLTGDFRSLSRVDMQVIALTYQLEVEHNGSDHLRSTPVIDIKVNQGFGDDKCTNIGFYIPKKCQDYTCRTPSFCEDFFCENVSENSSEDGSEALDEVLEGVDNLGIDNEGWTTVPGKSNNSKVIDILEEEFEDYEIDSDEDDEEWITPSNIRQKKCELLKNINVACISTDFAIQNMLLQIGLNVIGVDGMVIRYAKTYVLKCYGCFKVSEDCTKQFCPKCGNRTLEKVAVTVDEDGTKWYQKLSQKERTTRGVRYSLPLPKGGRNSNMPHITEDQPDKKFHLDTSVKQTVDVMSADFVKSGSPFGMTKVDTRAFLCRPTPARKGNPNQVAGRTGNRKKKKR